MSTVQHRAGGALFAALFIVYIAPSIASDAEVVMVLNSRDDSMSLIDPRSYTEIRRIPIGKEPHHLLPTPDNKHLVIANTKTNDLVIVDPVTGDIRHRVPRIADPYHLGFSRDGRWFVANGNRLDRVDVYRYDNLKFELVAKLSLPDTPSHMTFSDDNTVFVSLQDNNQLVAIALDTQQVKWKVVTGPAPAGVWLTPDGKNLMVAATAADFVEVFDTHTGAKRTQFTTGKGAHNFMPLGDGRHVLLSNRVEGSIVKIDQHTLSVVEKYQVPGGPDDMEVTADGKELWVTQRWRNEVAVVDLATKKIKKSIKVGRSPHGIYRHTHAPRT
jgi:YVTN family beta-propeller protein